MGNPRLVHRKRLLKRHHISNIIPTDTRGQQQAGNSITHRGNPLVSWVDKGSRHSRGYNAAWVKLRKIILKRDMYLCQACLRKGRPTPLGVKPYDHAVDHIKPKAKGGTDDPDNLESLCAPCHDAKTIIDSGGTITKAIGLDGWPID